ncbi:hypothetical protein G6F32_015687 [Rhizopus arrhizus]|nr:hypothetical protein G6F32_015687 [Rhizopus arrhizus]
MASTQGIPYLGAALAKTNRQRDQVTEVQQLARGQQPFVRLEERGDLQALLRTNLRVLVGPCSIRHRLRAGAIACCIDNLILGARDRAQHVA